MSKKVRSIYGVFILISFIFIGSVHANPIFFASPDIQIKFPKAFVLNLQLEPFLKTLDILSLKERSAIVEQIKTKPALLRAIERWDTMTTLEQIPFLKQIFTIEVEVLKIQPPELSFDGDLIPNRAAFFDFDLLNPSPGRVILNPEILQGMNKYASISLLIHETRHSAQFQMAFLNSEYSYVGSIYKEAFEVQSLGVAKTFCDFLTLANEHEAFYFGNSILGQLTNWSVDIPDMGTFATQFNQSGELKIDLIKIMNNGQPGTLLEKFNVLELEQCKLLGVCK